MSIVGDLLAWLVDLLDTRFGNRSSGVAIVALVAANLFPVAGVLFFGWNVWTILALYWLENGIVGLFNIPKLLLARGPMVVPLRAAGSLTLPLRLPAAARFVAVPFFVFHYGMFWLVHGLFVLVVLPSATRFGGDQLDLAPTLVPSPGTLALAAIALFGSHLVSFWTNFLGGREYERRSAIQQMAEPYRRVVLLHVTLVVGGIVASVTTAPIGLLLVLVALKIGLDLRFHLREHGSIASGAGRAEPLPNTAP